MSVRTAEKKAEELLSRYDNITHPINLESIAEDYGILIQYARYDDNQLSGLLIRDNDSKTYVIGVNASHPTCRQNFTIAHEIGHFLLHEGQETHIDKNITVNYRNSLSSNGTRNEEIEANAFAAALLMPENLLEDYIDEHFEGNINYNDDEQITKIADAFGVSSQALMIRLSKLHWFE